jgi:hypothetical protein
MKYTIVLKAINSFQNSFQNSIYYLLFIMPHCLCWQIHRPYYTCYNYYTIKFHYGWLRAKKRFIIYYYYLYYYFVTVINPNIISYQIYHSININYRYISLGHMNKYTWKDSNNHHINQVHLSITAYTKLIN